MTEKRVIRRRHGETIADARLRAHPAWRHRILRIVNDRNAYWVFVLGAG